MDLLVDSEIRGLREGLVADGADVGLGFGVDASMSVEIGAIGEALAAFLANVGFALEVNVHVVLEGGGVREAFVAAGMGAAEVAFVVVDAHVLVECGEAGVAALAVVAREETLVCVDSGGGRGVSGGRRGRGEEVGSGRVGSVRHDAGHVGAGRRGAGGGGCAVISG